MDDVAEIPHAGAQPSTLVEYNTIDFGTDSDLRQKLLQRVEREAALDEIALSDIADDVPSFLTPEMRAWYQDHVAFHRTNALEEVKKLFAEDRSQGGVTTRLVEAERHRIEDDFLRERRTLRRKYLQSRAADRQRLEGLTNEAAVVQADYADLHASLGREPVLYPFWVYGLVLFGVGVAESLVNFDAFASLPWATPFIATGLTLLVAAAIALAAHMHGTLLKQYRAYFEDDVDPKKRAVAIRMFSVGTTALVLALGAVYYARDTYITQSMMVDASLGGGAASLGHKLWVIGGSMFGNMLVYLVGVIVAFFVHDEIPVFPELKRKLTKLIAERDTLRRELDDAEQKIMRAAETRRTHSLEDLGRIEKAQKAAPKLAENRKLFEGLAAQDARVLGALEAYRIALCQQLKGRKAHFLQMDAIEPDSTHRLSPAQYLHLSLNLKYN